MGADSKRDDRRLARQRLRERLYWWRRRQGLRRFSACFVAILAISAGSTNGTCSASGNLRYETARMERAADYISIVDTPIYNRFAACMSVTYRLNLLGFSFNPKVHIADFIFRERWGFFWYFINFVQETDTDIYQFSGSFSVVMNNDRNRVYRGARKFINDLPAITQFLDYGVESEPHRKEIGSFDPWQRISDAACCPVRQPHGRELPTHDFRLASVDQQLPGNNEQLKEAHPSQEYVSDLQGLTALGCIVGGSSVMAWGLLGRWRRRARIAIAAMGIACFVFGYGVLIIPAL